jgi:predicted adenylyl cyclase CyaB
MQEIEAKILEIDRREVEDTLARMGAAKKFDGEVETLFYDFKDGSIVKAKNVMRLRSENKHFVLTYKNVKRNQQAKEAEEYSVVVSDLVIMQKILKSLGLVVIDSTKKYRISYELAGVHFDIDRYLGKYSYIPEFLEIEADSVKSIHKYAKALGLGAKDCLPWSTAQVIEHYSQMKEK